MKSERILHSLGNVSEEFIAEAAPGKRSARPRRWVKWTVAACVCLLLGTATAYAAGGFGTRIVEMFTGKAEPGSDLSESGYDLAADTEKIPVSSLTGEIREAGTLIVKQFEEYKPYMNTAPGILIKDFSSSEEARAYIGLDILRGLDWDLTEQSTQVWVHGNEAGELLQIDSSTDYEVDGLRLTALSHLYTENYPYEVGLSMRSTEEITFSESRFTSAKGTEVQVIASTSLESGYQMLEGYLVEDGILYDLHIAFLAKDADEAQTLLHQWAELFG